MDSNPTQVANLTLDEFLSQQEARQNLPMAILAGAVASVACAALWAAITVVSHYQIGYIAIAVGFIVGFAVRQAGRGLGKQFGVVGAVFALLGCVLGNFLSMVGFVSVEEQVNFFELLFALDYAIVPQVMVDAFQPIDLLFYGLALYAGYRYSFRKFSDAELSSLRG